MNTAANNAIVLASTATAALKITATFAPAFALTGLLLLTYRWISARSVTLGYLFAGGLIIRAILGVALFLISFLGLPLFRSLQLGGGFWTLAVDGRVYYEIASTAVAHGMNSISDTMPSPLYLRALALWMRVFGVSPASALLLNVASYSATAVLILIAADLDRGSAAHQTPGAVLALAAFSFSPATLIFGTQPLKDPVFIMFLVGGIAGARLWWRALYGPGLRRNTRMVAGAALLAVGIYGVGGIRAYIAFFMLMTFVLAAVYSIFVYAVPRRQRLLDSALHGALTIVLCMAFVSGAGPYAEAYEGILISTSRSPNTALTTLDSMRAGFSASGGATLVDASPDTSAVGGATYSAQLGPPPNNRLVRLARGVAILLIPISVLSAASFVHFGGGRGLLFVTDLDTAFIDVSALMTLWLLMSTRRQRPSPALMFALILGLVIAGSISYVVTNYGTIFRLRLMAVAVMWMLPVVIPRSARTASTADVLPGQGGS